MNRRELIHHALLAGCGAACAPAALAQPVAHARPITLFVPFSPGADTDVVARLIADGMSRELGQSIIVDNKVGAGGQIAMQTVANAPADGTRLILTVQAATTILPHLKLKPPYDPVRDFTPIGRVATSGNALVVRANSPIKNLADLVARAKQAPNQLSYGSWGIGSGGHLAGEIFNVKADMRTEHVAYKGTSEVLQALLSGELDYAFIGYGLATAQSKGGAVRVLSVLTSQRSPTWPDAPTLKEAGYDFVQDPWFAILGPTGIPESISRPLEAALMRASRAPAFSQRLATMGLAAAATDGAQLKTLIDSDSKLWAGWINRLALPKT